jgi:HK97 family phage prohead protease
METRSIKSEFVTTNNKISGYAIVFNAPAVLRGIQPRPSGFTEVIRPGSLRVATDLRLLWGHDRNAPLGNAARGTLAYKVDDKGLWFEATLPESATREREAIARGDADGMSFHFNLFKDKWDKDTRELLDIGIDEISITAFPAYPQTSVAMSRKKMEMELQIREKYRGDY